VIEYGKPFAATRLMFDVDESAETYRFKQLKPDALTYATRAVEKNRKIIPSGESIDEEGSTFDLDHIQRECPPNECPRKSTCPLPGGVCCGKGDVCCPAGATCLTTDPPTCVHDPPDSMFACAMEKCDTGFSCPHEGVEICCTGGKTCCKDGYTCVAGSFPVKCRRLKSGSESKQSSKVEESVNSSPKSDKTQTLEEALKRQSTSSSSSSEKPMTQEQLAKEAKLIDKMSKDK